MFPWLLAIIGPLGKRLLLALGIGITTTVGLQVLVSNITIQIQSSFSGLSADIFGVVSLLGIPESIGIQLGALTTIASLQVAKRFSLL